MQEAPAANCPASPSRLLKNAVRSLPVRNSDIHSHSAFSELSPDASPARESTPEPDEPYSATASEQQQQPTSSQWMAAHAGCQGAASNRLQYSVSGPAAVAMRSSLTNGITGATMCTDTQAPMPAMIPTPCGACGAHPAAAAAAAPARIVFGSAALMLGATATFQRQFAATGAATRQAGVPAAPKQQQQQQMASAAAAPVAVKPDVVEISEDEDEQDTTTLAVAAAAVAAAAAAAAAEAFAAEVSAAAAAQAEAAAMAQGAAAAAAANDGYDEAALQADGPGRINLTSKSRPTYGNSGNQQDTRVMIVRRLRAALAAAGAARQSRTLGGVYDDVNTNGGLSARGLKWKAAHLDEFYTRVLGSNGVPGAAPWPSKQELKPYLELRYLARLFSWLTGRRVTVPQVNACFVDGTADWVAVEANVTALLGVPAAQLQLPLRPLQQQQLQQPQLPQQPLMQAPPLLLQQQQQPAASALHSSYLSAGTAVAPVHGTQGAAATALASLAAPGRQASSKRYKITSAAAAQVAHSGGKAPTSSSDATVAVKQERR